MIIHINLKKELFRWGPIEVLPIYADYWNMGMPVFYEDYDPGWVPFLTYFKKDKGQIACEYEKLYGNGEKIFKKFILDDKNFALHYKRWQKLLEDFNQFSRYFNLKNMEILSDIQFKKAYLEWNKFYGREFWNIGALPEAANWGGEAALARELRKKLGGEEDFHYAFEKLSAPESLSFYQKEELDLLKIKLIKDRKKAEEMIKEHQKKYFWLLNSYRRTKTLTVKYFKKILEPYTARDADKKIKEIEEYKKYVSEEKMKVSRKFNLPKRVLKIGERLSFCVWWQDVRKSYIFQANHIIDNFFREIERRHKVDFYDLHYYKVKELENLVKRIKKVSASEMKKRKTHFLIITDGKNKFYYFSGKKARELSRPYLEVKIDKNAKEIRGIVVSQGRARGKARIINTPAEARKMKKGDILVAPMTSPDYILALKKASAVITDEGGMTCHAAIVSRELRIPGIVGAKIATKVLKDGDLVEVDAEKGIVKVLKR